MKIKNVLIAVLMLLLMSASGINIAAVPDVYVINVGEETILTLNLDDNSVNGAAWVQIFRFESIDPVVPWVSF